MATRDHSEPVLEIDGLEIAFDTPDGPVEAVRGVSMRVGAGETVAVVGESGSGKSQVMMAAMGLLASNGTAKGSVRYRGEEILNIAPARLNRLRGAKITMIFQEPMTSLDPLYTIEEQMVEPLRCPRPSGPACRLAPACSTFCASCRSPSRKPG